MSDAWENTRGSINRLKAAWRDADEDTQWDIGFCAAGLATMAGAVIAHFGWTGAIFCVGAVVFAAGNRALKRT